MWARKDLLVEGTHLTAMCVKVLKAVILLSNLFFKSLFLDPVLLLVNFQLLNACVVNVTQLIT